jgi:uncharacterized protein YhhL (DUF1145 family)
MLVYWAAFIVSFIKAFVEPYQAIIFWSGLILLVVHLAEWIMHRKKLESLNAGGANGFVQTVLFGIVYWLPIFRKA